MKKVLALIGVLISSMSLFGYTHKVHFNESAIKGGGTYRITAHVVAHGADTREVKPSATPYVFTTFGANCVDRIEITVVGGEYDGTHLNAPLRLFTRCVDHSLRIDKAGNMAPGKSGLFKSGDGKLELEVTP